MEAIILAGGLGTRLRSVVSTVPKVMAPVAGRPFLSFLLNSMAQKGFSRVILSLGYMAETISDYFGSHFEGMSIEYVKEQAALGTGGATRLAITICEEDHVFVFNGDSYIEFEFKLLEKQWQKNRNPIVVCREVTETSRFGRVVAKENRILNFSEKGAFGPGTINAGCYLLPRYALEEFPLYQPFSIERDYLSIEVKKSTVEMFLAEGLFIDIGVPEDYSRSQSLLSTK